MNIDSRRPVRTCLVWLALLLICSSCGSVSMLGSKKAVFFEHTVKWSEENLYNITVWHTGSLDKYSEVREANPNISPYGLSAGDKVLIPQSIITNREPMPKFSDKSKQGSSKPLPIQPTGRNYYSHRVTLQGESVSIIAKWYTGDLKNWKILAEANPNLNPNRIELGDEILIPEDLMIRRDSISKSFVDSFTQKKRKISTSPPPTPISPPPPEPAEEDNDIELVPPKF